MSHRFFLPPTAWSDGQVHLDAALAHQIAHVLRLRPGAHVVVFDNSGLEYEVELNEVRSDRVTGRVCAQYHVHTEPSVSLSLYAAVLKGDKFEWVLQKGTELGVHCFVPIISERTVVRDPAQIEDKRKRWERIIQEAAEQSGRVRLPILAAPLLLQAAMTQSMAQNDLSLLPSPGLSAPSPADRLNGRSTPSHIGLFIGPEGGFSAAEVTQAQAAGLLSVSLGPRILRAETASIVAVALTMAALRELQ